MTLINQEQVDSLKEALDQDTVKEILEMYALDAAENLNEISLHVNNRDFVALKAAAHSLKGSSANIGAQGMQTLCKELEEFAMDQDLAAVTVCYEKMIEMLPGMIVALGNAYA